MLLEGHTAYAYEYSLGQILQCIYSGLQIQNSCHTQIGSRRWLLSVLWFCGLFTLQSKYRPFTPSIMTATLKEFFPTDELYVELYNL